MNRLTRLILTVAGAGLMILLLVLAVGAQVPIEVRADPINVAAGYSTIRAANDSAARPASAPQAGAPHTGPAATPPPLDCTKPLPGQVARIVEDDEIVVFGDVDAQPGWDDSGTMQLDRLHNPSQSQDLVYDWDWEQTGNDPTYDIIWPVVATGDLDADGKDEVISAAKNQDNNGTLEVRAFLNPEVTDSTDLQVDTLQGWNVLMQGADLNHFDIATGNLARTANGAEQAALAFRDNNDNLHLLLIAENTSGGIDFFGEWWCSSNCVGFNGVGDVSVDVGDLDGDGYNDEIVVAFVDGNGHLDVAVFEWNGSSGLYGVEGLAQGIWTDNNRGGLNLNYAAGIDVTTGDFNGDGKDEIATAFRDGSAALQVMQIEYDPTSGSLTSSGWWRNTSYGRNNVDMISIGSGDIDDDGYDEIVTAFANSPYNLSFVTFDAESGTPTLHGSWVNGGDALAGIAWTSVDVGDIDADSKAEVVVAFKDGNDALQTISYSDNPACPCADDGSSGLIQRNVWQDGNDGRGSAGMTWIALGDVNGDNVYGDYTGVCTQTMEVRTTALVGRPPYWQALNPDDNEVGYGKSASSENQSDQEVTTNYGASVTADGTFEIGDFRLGPSQIRDWEHSVTSSTATGTQIETRDGWSMDGDGFVPLNGVTYYSYQYKRRDNGGLARVGVPVATATDAKTMTYWNDPAGERTVAPASWTPAYRSGWMDPETIATLSSYFAAGDVFPGEGADIADVNGNGKPDYLHAVIAGLYGSGHNVYYQVGFDLLPNGVPKTTSGWIAIWDSIGNYSSGLGAALTELNGNSTPELVLAWVDDPAGQHNAYYRVVWDLAANGQYKGWSAKQQIPGWVGLSTQGADLDVLDLNGNGRPELVFGWIDNPGDVNQGYYRVGWDLDANGDVANWWTDPQEIKGDFGPQDAGLGLKLADVNGDGQAELVAAWVRTEAAGNEWAYAVGEDLDANAIVGSWAPGLPVPGWVGDTTDAATLAAADLVTGDNRPELVVGWLDHATGGDVAWLRVGQFWPLGGDPDQYPTAITDTNPTDGQFQMVLQNHVWNVSGDVNWRWDADPSNQPIVVAVGSANSTWSVDQSQFIEHVTGTGRSYNIEIGGEATFMGVGVEGSSSYGFEDGSSQSISWDQGWYMEGQTSGLPSNAPPAKDYQYVPFTYMQEARSIAGHQQGYMVLDYFVSIGEAPLEPGTPATAPGATPGAPLIASPSHPDPDTWYPANTAVFTWAQPAGDPAVVNGYRWYLDRHPDTVPSHFSQALTTTTTYTNFPDGLWYLHVRARDQGGSWGATAHRAVRIDAHPPQVQIGLNPPLPSANDGWYNTPVTVTITAADPSTSAGQNGSGVASVEVSTDGVTWQPYTGPLIHDVDLPLTRLWARATDAVGNTSTPVSTTFGVDLTPPNSVAGPGCWDPGGDCLAEVFTDAVGNQYLHLSGEVDGSLSGLKELAIQVNGANWVPATAIDGVRWFFTSTMELGGGCHTFALQAGDRAGNTETAHTFVSGVAWLPRQQPDLAGSSLWAEPATVRPGEVVPFSGVARNSGWQETWVPITVDLPSGLEILPDTIKGGGVYDPATRAITWPPLYLWPGQDRQLSFSARVDAALPATTLIVPLTVQGTWPIAGDCPPGAMPAFLAFQTTTTVSTTVTVNPTLPAGADVLPPTLHRLRIAGPPSTSVREVELRLHASPDARWMYLREWTWNPAGGSWDVAQESGWLPYAASHRWTLSAGDGVKYLGAWLADAAGNVSVLNNRGLAFINLLNRRQSLDAGQRIQYRFPLYYGPLAVFNAIADAGNPDLYVWQPWSGFRPHYSATGTGLVDTVGFYAPRDGPYLVEVQAEEDTEYELLLAGNVGSSAGSASRVAADTPEHPLTVSDPLSAGVAAAPAPPHLYKLHLPLSERNQ